MLNLKVGCCRNFLLVISGKEIINNVIKYTTKSGS